MKTIKGQNKYKIDKNGQCYIEDQYGERHYTFAFNDSPFDTRVYKRISKETLRTILFLVFIWTFTIYFLFIR
jgi:hypothetical protein